MRFLAFLTISAMGISEGSAQVIINELMQSNIDCIMDDINEFPDSWVELYNAGSVSVDLGEYSLGITANPAEAYALKSKTLYPGEHRLIYCDKTDKHDDTGWHAPFRLESGKGCCVYLFRDNEIVDSVEDLKKQPSPNIAYGREYDGSEVWGYEATPTPSVANCGEVYDRDRILGEPVFSVPGQVFEQPQEQLSLTLSVPEGAPEGTKIYFTFDGREPNASTASDEYIGRPISLYSSVVVRAKLVCDGYLSPRSTAQSYIVLRRSMTLPVVSIVTDQRYLTDNKIGIYVTGTYNSKKPNYKYDWRRPVNIELFDAPSTPSVLNQLCETRIQGGATRDNKLKSLAIYANKRFGEKRFSYEFFPGDKPGLTDFKSLLLRNAGNDFDYLYMRDAIIQRTMMKHVDVDWQAWRPAIIFINGEYRGIENIRERSNDDNIFSNYNGLEDIEVVENWYDVKTGDGSLFNAFKAFYNEHGHTWQEYDEVLDVSEFLDVIIMDIYFNNLDAPGNNFCIWRPTAEGGRWRAIIKDTDYTMNLYGDPYNYRILDWIYNADFDPNHNWGANGWEGTRLLRRLMEDETFKATLIDRLAVYMGDFMTYDGVWEVWEPMYEVIRDEYPKHRQLFNAWWPNYNDEMNNVKNWLRNRNPFLYSHMSEYFHLGIPVKLEVNKSVPDMELSGMSVSVNGVSLSRNVFDGKFFAKREVRLSGEHVASWQVVTNHYNGTVTTQTFSGAECSFPMPECTSVQVTAIAGESDGIEVLAGGVQSEAMQCFDANGVRHDRLQHGANIVRMSDGSVRRVLIP